MSIKIISKIINFGIKKVLWPISRWYNRHIIRDKTADSFIQFINSIDFWFVHRYWPNLKKPRSFSEKIYCRMLFCRAPQLTMLSDKLASRDFIRDRVGPEHLVPLLWRGRDPKNVPFENLPDKFVIKSNHGCQYNIIIKDKKSINQNHIKQILNKWLKQNFATDIFTGISWGYKHINPEILIEEFIGEDNKEPIDYKFFCFHGKALYTQVNYDRFGDAKENFFDRDYTFLNIWNDGGDCDLTKLDKPQNYQTMLQLADTISHGFDFLRIDLYSINCKIYVGEVTCYPAGGRARFEPKNYDFIFGENWKINTTKAISLFTHSI